MRHIKDKEITWKLIDELLDVDDYQVNKEKKDKKTYEKIN